MKDDLVNPLKWNILGKRINQKLLKMRKLQLKELAFILFINKSVMFIENIMNICHICKYIHI